MNQHRANIGTDYARIIKSPKTRRYLYRVALAVIALLAFYGILTDESLALIGTVIAAVLSLPLADANVHQDGHDADA